MASITCPTGAFTTSAFFSLGSGTTNSSTTYTYSCSPSAPPTSSQLSIVYGGTNPNLIRHPVPSTPGPSLLYFSWGLQSANTLDFPKSRLPTSVVVKMTVIGPGASTGIPNPPAGSYALYPTINITFPSLDTIVYNLNGTVTISNSNRGEGHAEEITFRLRTIQVIAPAASTISYLIDPSNWTVTSSPSPTDAPTTIVGLNPNFHYTVAAQFNFFSNEL